MFKLEILRGKIVLYLHHTCSEFASRLSTETTKRMTAISFLSEADAVDQQKTQSTNRHRHHTGGKHLRRCCRLLNRQMTAVSNVVWGATAAALWEVAAEGELCLSLTGSCCYSR